MSKNEPTRKALGKGLHSLLPSRSTSASIPTPTATQPVATSNPSAEAIRFIPLGELKPNVNQPRHNFDEIALAELAQSIARDGILQPILARQTGPNLYQIVAGERRWRAAHIAGLKEVPVIVREVEDRRILELALIENIQREDLDPIDLARGFERMAEELGLSHQEIGERTGKDRATVTNSLRLLQLPNKIQALVGEKKLSPGHARALLRFDDEAIQKEVAEKCIAEGWSVRQIEEFARGGTEAVVRKPRGKTALPQLDPNVKAALADLEAALGTRVRIVEKAGGKGQIEIEYYSGDDLSRIYDVILHQ